MRGIHGVSNSYLQSVFTAVLQKQSKQRRRGRVTTDSQQLSPFAQLMSTQLQQPDPTQYQQVTQQIATNLQSAAQTAQVEGNSTAVNQLNLLA
jgi:hypothetical protein